MVLVLVLIRMSSTPLNRSVCRVLMGEAVTMTRKAVTMNLGQVAKGPKIFFHTVL